MEHADAERLAAQLQSEHRDRVTHRFFARCKPDGAWSVAKMLVPEQLRSTPLQVTAEHEPHRPFADDGRSGHELRVPGLPGGLG